MFVHCIEGKSRSASIVIAFLMDVEGMSLQDAYALLKRGRPIANPNEGFQIQLQHHENLKKNRIAAGPAFHQQGMAHNPFLGAVSNAPKGPAVAQHPHQHQHQHQQHQHQVGLPPNYAVAPNNGMLSNMNAMPPQRPTAVTMMQHVAPQQGVPQHQHQHQHEMQLVPQNLPHQELHSMLPPQQRQPEMHMVHPDVHAMHQQQQQHKQTISQVKPYSLAVSYSNHDMSGGTNTASMVEHHDEAYSLQSRPQIHAHAQSHYPNQASSMHQSQVWDDSSANQSSANAGDIYFQHNQHRSQFEGRHYSPPRSYSPSNAQTYGYNGSDTRQFERASSPAPHVIVKSNAPGHQMAGQMRTANQPAHSAQATTASSTPQSPALHAMPQNMSLAQQQRAQAQRNVFANFQRSHGGPPPPVPIRSPRSEAGRGVPYQNSRSVHSREQAPAYDYHSSAYGGGDVEVRPQMFQAGTNGEDKFKQVPTGRDPTIFEDEPSILLEPSHVRMQPRQFTSSWSDGDAYPSSRDEGRRAYQASVSEPSGHAYNPSQKQQASSHLQGYLGEQVSFVSQTQMDRIPMYQGSSLTAPLDVADNHSQQTGLTANEYPRVDRYSVNSGAGLVPSGGDLFLDESMHAGIEALLLEDEVTDEYNVGQVKRMQVRGKPGVMATELTC